MKKSTIDKAVALLEEQRQAVIVKLDMLNAAIDALLRAQAAARPAKKKLRPVKPSEAAS